MRTNRNQYNRMVKDACPNSRVGKNCLWAFFVGGGICLLGEIMTKAYMDAHFTIGDARTLTSITLVGISAVLTATGWYARIAKRAGAGTLVPITGFANAVVSPAIEFKTEGYITGVASRMFIIAGPVIVYGIIASVVYGAVLYLKGRYGF